MLLLLPIRLKVAIRVWKVNQTSTEYSNNCIIINVGQQRGVWPTTCNNNEKKKWKLCQKTKSIINII